MFRPATRASAATPTSPTRSFESGRFALSSLMDARVSRTPAARAAKPASPTFVPMRATSSSLSKPAATAAQEPSSNPRTPSILRLTTLRSLGAPIPKTALSGRAQDCAGV